MGQAVSSSTEFSYKLSLATSFPTKNLLTDRQDTITIVCPNLQALIANKTVYCNNLLYRIIQDTTFDGYNFRNIYLINSYMQVLTKIVCTDFTRENVIAVNVDNLSLINP
jgi:hypothetical protein